MGKHLQKHKRTIGLRWLRGALAAPLMIGLVSTAAWAQSTDVANWVLKPPGPGEAGVFFVHKDLGEKAALFEGIIPDESKIAEFIFSLEDICPGISAAREKKELANRLTIKFVGGRGDDECAVGLYRVDGKMRTVMVLRERSVKFSTRDAVKKWAAQIMASGGGGTPSAPASNTR